MQKPGSHVPQVRDRWRFRMLGRRSWAESLDAAAGGGRLLEMRAA